MEKKHKESKEDKENKVKMKQAKINSVSKQKYTQDLKTKVKQSTTRVQLECLGYQSMFENHVRCEMIPHLASPRALHTSQVFHSCPIWS